MKTSKVLMILIPLILMGVGILIYSTTQKEEIEKKPEKESVETSVVIEKDGGLKETNVAGFTFSESTKLVWVEPENKEIKAQNKELEQLKEEYKMEVNVYQQKEKEMKEDMVYFLIVFENNSKKDFQKELDFPCEYFLTLYENDTFLETKKQCQATQKEMLKVPAGEHYHFVLAKKMTSDKNTKKVFMETPFGVGETTVNFK